MNATEMTKLLRHLGACESARSWAKGKSLAEIWMQCDRTDWLLWLVGRMSGKSGWPDRKEIVLVACDCAELALLYVKPGEDRPRIAIETARAWVRGEATIESVREARRATIESVREARRAAAYAAAAAAYAAAAAADAADAADADAYAAAAAAAAAAYAAAYAAALKDLRAKCLAIIREKLTPDCLKPVQKGPNQ